MPVSFQVLIREARVLIKAAPGPAPRVGLEWRERTHRWVRPGTASSPKRSSPKVYSPKGSSPKVSPHRAALVSALAEREPARRHSKLTNDTDGVIPRIKQEVASTFDPYGTSSYLNPKEHEVLYSGSGFGYIETGHKSVNKVMRGEQSMTENIQRKIDGIMALMQPLGTPQILYRGIPVALLNIEGNPVQAGDVIEFDTFVSTSRSPERPLFTFMDRWSHTPEMMTFMEIQAPESAQGITMSNDETHTPEDETLLAAGQLFQVDFVQEVRPGVMYVGGTIIS